MSNPKFNVDNLKLIYSIATAYSAFHPQLARIAQLCDSEQKQPTHKALEAASQIMIEAVIEMNNAVQSHLDGLEEVVVPEGWSLLKDSTQEERSFPEDQGHENGNYHNECVMCLRMFTGDKRRSVCKVCEVLKS